MSGAILETANLTKQFGGLKAVDDLSFAFSPDVLYAIIGPNGAGKTTLFNLITGVIPPTNGRVIFKGEDITDLDSKEVARKKLVRSYQLTQIFGELSVLENVRVAVQSNYNPYNFWSDINDFPELTEKAHSILERVGLEEKGDVAADALSHGEQRTLEIAIALGADPEMLLLDEPSSGMSLEETKEVIQLVDKLSQTLPIILIEHKMSVVRQVADEILVLHNGRELASGPPERIHENEDVRRVYLGGEQL